MGAFERWSYDRDQDKPTEQTAVTESTEASHLLLLDETATRGETYADYRQTVQSGWDRQRRFEPPRAELALFELEHAGLPDIRQEQADRHVGSTAPGVRGLMR